MANKDRNAIESGLNDILGNVIRTDRERSGRASDGESATASHTDSPASNKVETGAKKQYDNMTSRQTNIGDSEENRSEIEAGTPDGSDDDPALQRADEAKIMAASATMTVTLRIPHAFNDWLDEYVHRSWPKKIRKQELVIEALKLLYARRGRAGETIVTTPLLDDGSD